MMVNKEASSVTCIVPGCQSSNLTSPGKVFFKISFQEERCQHWLLVCQREDLLEKQNSTSNEEFAVCSDHFIGDHFENSSRTRLKKSAVPTVFSKIDHFSENEVHYDIKGDDDRMFNIEDTKIKTELEDADDDVEENYPQCDSEEWEDASHPGQLCRLCALVVDKAVYMFTDAGLELNLADKINTTLPIMVKENDPLPKQLCASCATKVDMYHTFAEACIEGEQKLYSILKHKHFRSQVISEQWKTSSRNTSTSNNGKDFRISSANKCSDEVKAADPGPSKNTSGPLFEDDSTRLEDCELLVPKDEDLDDCADLTEEKLARLGMEDCVSYSCPLCCGGVVNAVSEEKRRKLENDDSFREFLCDSGSEHSFKDSGSKLYMSSKDSEWSEDNTMGSGDLDSSIAEDSLQRGIVYEAINESGDNYTVVDTASDWWNSGNIMDNTEVVIETLNSGDSKGNQNLEGKADILIKDETMIKLELEEGNLPYCCICEEAFMNIEVCLEHSKVHFDANSYPCSLCGKSFNNELDLRNHFKEHPPEEKKIKQKGKRLVCDICNRRFNTERTFISHSCVTPETKQYRCSVCKKSYSSEERLTFHQKFHKGAKLNYCDQCGKEFDNEGSLYYHTRMVHEGERPFSCNMCNKKFYSNSRLVAHKRVHTGERPFECEVCGRRFYDRETLKGHYVTHLSVKPFQCDLCGMCWGRKSMLNQHLRTHHSDPQNSDLNMPRRVPSLIHYYCKMCDTTFTSSSEVLSHRTTHWDTNKTTQSDSANSHICEYCGQSFTMMSSLAKHRKEEHPHEQPYICSICKETSHTLYEARAHRKTHIEQDPKLKLDGMKSGKSLMFVCEACGNIFTEKRKFVRHLKEHKVGRAYQCKVCGKEFTDNQRLTVHMRQHTGEKPYTCTVCGKKFTQTSALYTHALLHTGEKPHSCDLCGKAFRIKADRDNHRRTHTGEKPYKCEFCGKTFRTGQVYYQHRMIHTGERRFPCNICGKAFKRSHTLVVHKRIHTGEKPNICDVCGKGFRQRSDMRKHRALHGPID